MINGLYILKDSVINKPHIEIIYVYMGEGLSKGSHIWSWWDGPKAGWITECSMLSPNDSDLEFTGVTVKQEKG